MTLNTRTIKKDYFNVYNSFCKNLALLSIKSNRTKTKTDKCRKEARI